MKWISFLWKKKYIPAIIPFAECRDSHYLIMNFRLELELENEDIKAIKALGVQVKNKKCDARFPTTSQNTLLQYVIFYLLVKTNKTIFSSLMKKRKSYIDTVMHSIQIIWPYVLENTALSHSSGPIRFVKASCDTVRGEICSTTPPHGEPLPAVWSREKNGKMSSAGRKPSDFQIIDQQNKVRLLHL